MDTSVSTISSILVFTSRIGTNTIEPAQSRKQSRSNSHSQDDLTVESPAGTYATDNNVENATEKVGHEFEQGFERALQNQKEPGTSDTQSDNTAAGQQSEVIRPQPTKKPVEPRESRLTVQNAGLVKGPNPMKASGTLIDTHVNVNGPEFVHATVGMPHLLNESSIQNLAKARIGAGFSQPAPERIKIGSQIRLQKGQNNEQGNSTDNGGKDSNSVGTNQGPGKIIPDSVGLDQKEVGVSKAPDTEPLARQMSPKIARDSANAVQDRIPERESAAHSARGTSDHNSNEAALTDLSRTSTDGAGISSDADREQNLLKGIAAKYDRTYSKHTTGSDNLTSRGSSSLPGEQIAPENSPGIKSLETGLNPAQLSKSSQANTAPGSVVQQVQESIQTSIRQGNRQITIRLNPPELGRVSIKFEQKADQITGLLEVSELRTKYEMQQAIPQIIRNLTDSGIQMKRLDIALTNQSDPQADKDQSLHDNLLQQHGFTRDSAPDSTREGGSPITVDNLTDSAEPENVLFTAQAINMLM